MDISFTYVDRYQINKKIGGEGGAIFNNVKTVGNIYFYKWLFTGYKKWILCNITGDDKKRL